MPLRELNPDDIPEFASREPVSYQICKEFLGSTMKLCMVDMADFPGKKASSISSSLNNYIRAHDLPMKNTYKRGNVYLYRTDIDEYGKVEPKNLDDYVDTGFQLPVGKADPELVARENIPTLSVGVARQRLEEELDPE
jgi:hypothetical protein